MDKKKAGYIEGTVSIAVNTVLFVLKIWASIISGSIALAADAWHTLSDSISSVVVVIAAKLASKKADKEHPYGHGRWEQIASIFIAVILAIIAFSFLENSIRQFISGEKVVFGTLAIIVTAISIAVKEILAQYAFYIARKTDNSNVKADAWHHRSDALSSAVILAGIFFAKQFAWLDSVLGIIVALMLFHVTYVILKDAITKILGQDLDQKLIDEITDIIKSIYNDDLDVHHFHLHNYISHKELTFHIRLNDDLTVGQAHKIAYKIEQGIEAKYELTTVTIHVEPMEPITP